MAPVAQWKLRVQAMVAAIDSMATPRPLTPGEKETGLRVFLDRWLERDGIEN